MCYCYNAPPSILKRKKAQREPVAPWKKHSLKMSVALSARPGVLKQLRLKIVLIDEFEGARSVDGAACAFLSVLRITWTKTKALHYCGCTAGSYYIQCVFAYVCFLVWVTSSCTADLVCVIAVENTNLANTSKAVCHFGTALLGAPLTHWTSQHFSLFTVAHAKPPLHLKSLQHVVNSLPKGNLHFFPPLLRVRPVRNTKGENCYCIAAGGTVSDTLCYLRNSIDRLLVVIISCLVCSESSTW